MPCEAVHPVPPRRGESLQVVFGDLRLATDQLDVTHVERIRDDRSQGFIADIRRAESRSVEDLGPSRFRCHECLPLFD